MNLPELIPLSDYTAPTMPTDRILQATWARVKQRISGPKDPLHQRSDLGRVSLAAIHDLTEAPDCEPMLQTLDTQFSEWSRDAGAHPKLRTLIMPPCDQVGMLATWAQTRGHQVLREPRRIDLTQLGAQEAEFDLCGPGLLVIPRLEHWFVRERNGMQSLRYLLTQLANTERRCLVGCDSWAWRFIVKSADAELTLAHPQTFEPFDARRLRDWFATLARDSDANMATFRLASNGEDVLACNSDGEPHNNHLREIAALSGGVPWVAWHLWRVSLKVSTADEPLSDRAAGATADDSRTVWVVGVDDVALPRSNVDRSLLVLHALLIHGSLTPHELEAVLPATGEPNMLSALITSGHLQRDRDSDHHRVKPSAYPAIHKALKAAGLPTGVM